MVSILTLGLGDLLSQQFYNQKAMQADAMYYLSE